MPKLKKIKQIFPYDNIACCFQGGGSMGAYQVGALHALQEAGFCPDWFVGTSIGAINSSIAAGNAVEDRFDKLQAFWHYIATPSIVEDKDLPHDVISTRVQHFLSSQSSLLFGQTGFFSPRFPSPMLGLNTSVDSLSFYDTSALRTTLERFVDFDRINARSHRLAKGLKNSRLSLGAVNVRTGKMTYFDSTKQKIGPEHIMASGALPPGFPAIEIEGQFYWDGGLSSNSPVTYVLESKRSKAQLCFMIHLFDSFGLLPTTLDDIEKRKKDIEFSSKFNKIVELYKEIHALKNIVHHLVEHIPEKKKLEATIKKYSTKGWDKTMALVRFMSKADESELSSKDYDFSLQSINRLIAKGYADAKKGAVKAPWLDPPPLDTGVVFHDMAELEELKEEIKELDHE